MIHPREIMRRENGRIRWSPISLDEGLLLRALAILAIIAHNYLHWIEGGPGENEFDFQGHRADDFWKLVASQPLDLVRWLAGYFGHYGVQVFLFLSGYGLAMQGGKNELGWWAFQKRRWRKLMPAVLIAALGYFLYEGLRIGWYEVWHEQGLNLLRQCLGISNFIPENVYKPIGPWWYLGVLWQFYAVAPFLIKQKTRMWVIAGWMLIALAGEYFIASPMLEHWGVNWNHTILGHFDVCLAGVLVARMGSFSLSKMWVGLAWLAFFVGSFSKELWPLTGLVSLVAFIPILRIIAGWMTRFTMPLVAGRWLGELSLYLFLCNGYLRRPLVDWVNRDPHWWTHLWSLGVFFTLTLAWAVLLRRVEKFCIDCAGRLPHK